MPNGPERALPARPSAEFLRKEAKRLARARSIGLAAAQRALAADYGFASWGDLLRHVAGSAGQAPARSPLAAAARDADINAASRLLAEGEPVDGRREDPATPLWEVCASGEDDTARLALATLLLESGADTAAAGRDGAPLHAAAARGPLAMVELLIRHGALEWQPDRRGRTPLGAARRGSAADKRQIAELLDRPVIRDPGFRAAVEAIRSGDAAALGALLDAQPRLLEARIEEPDCYRSAPRHQYFLDPKLFWFVANNPGWMKAMPPNIVEIAETMIARGVARPDLDYALELVMTSASAREQGQQQPLMRSILAAGGTPSAHSIEIALAHGELEPVRALIALGQPVTAPIAAALGETAKLRELLGSASDAERQSALAMAVINARAEAAAVALAAGADPNRFMPVHVHSTPLHHAVLNEDLASMELLVDNGARTDVRDLLWKATPLEWAVHEDKPRASAWLEALSGPR
ncbi:MAG TPA: hypothetical protein VD887_11960 [Allosphingosinicella sp.]|nr:hypothetical protein [Allosphingosinicella sp.]